VPAAAARRQARGVRARPEEPQLIEQLKTGKTAVFIIFQTEEAGIGIPISLAGFGQALAALQ
jgi:invasion protein IalB